MGETACMKVMCCLSSFSCYRLNDHLSGHDNKSEKKALLEYFRDKEKEDKVPNKQKDEIRNNQDSV